MIELLGAALVFVGGHFVLSAHPIRSRMTSVMGQWPFLGIYSIVSLAAFWWMLSAYGNAPRVELWEPYIAFRHIAISAMPLVCIFLIAGYTSANPTALGFSVFKGLERGPRGIYRITRHPILWAIALWSLAHLMANASSADLILFGSLALLSVGGTCHLDRRKESELGDEWTAYCSETSNLPFGAVLEGRQKVVLSEIGIWRVAAGFVLYFGMLLVHQTVTGVSPLPLPAH